MELFIWAFSQKLNLSLLDVKPDNLPILSKLTETNLSHSTNLYSNNWNHKLRRLIPSIFAFLVLWLESVHIEPVFFIINTMIKGWSPNFASNTKQINFYSSWNHQIYNDFRGYRSQLISLNSLNIKSEI